MKYEKHFTVTDDGFNGSYYPCSPKSIKAIIEMFGDDTDDYLAKGGVKYFHGLGFSVMTMSPSWLIDFFIAYAFKEAKGFKKECRETRIELDRCISKAIAEW